MGARVSSDLLCPPVARTGQGNSELGRGKGRLNQLRLPRHGVEGERVGCKRWQLAVSAEQPSLEAGLPGPVRMS